MAHQIGDQKPTSHLAQQVRKIRALRADQQVMCATGVTGGGELQPSRTVAVEQITRQHALIDQPPGVRRRTFTIEWRTAEAARQVRRLVDRDERWQHLGAGGVAQKRRLAIKITARDCRQQVTYKTGREACLKQDGRLARGELARAEFGDRTRGGPPTDSVRRFERLGVTRRAIPVAALHSAIARAHHDAVETIARADITRREAMTVGIGMQPAVVTHACFIHLCDFTLRSARRLFAA